MIGLFFRFCSDSESLVVRGFISDGVVSKKMVTSDICHLDSKELKTRV